MNHNLNVPGNPNLTPSVGDTVTIKCENDQGFTWCFADTDDPQVFSDGFLSNGSYAKGSYGPYSVVNTGTVHYNGVVGQNQSCNPYGGAQATMHTIIVSN